MHATAMHLAILIPDWKSLDSVRHAHSVLEAAALIFFALLVLFALYLGRIATGGTPPLLAWTAAGIALVMVVLRVYARRR